MDAEEAFHARLAAEIKKLAGTSRPAPDDLLIRAAARLYTTSHPEMRVKLTEELYSIAWQRVLDLKGAIPNRGTIEDAAIELFTEMALKRGRAWCL